MGACLMPVPPIANWNVGTEPPTSTIFNSRIRDALNFLISRPMGVFRKSGNQSTSNNTATAIGWDVEDLDNDGGHSNVTNNTRYTSQSAGWFHVSCTLHWAANATGFREVWFRVNADNTRRHGYCVLEVDDGVEGKDTNSSTHIYLNAGDYVEVMGRQSSGGTLATTNDGRDTRFEIEWVSM